MISLSVVILTMVIVLGAIWMIVKFNKGESLDRKYREDTRKFQAQPGRTQAQTDNIRQYQRRPQRPRQQQKHNSTEGPAA